MMSLSAPRMKLARPHPLFVVWHKRIKEVLKVSLSVTLVAFDFGLGLFLQTGYLQDAMARLSEKWDSFFVLAVFFVSGQGAHELLPGVTCTQDYRGGGYGASVVVQRCVCTSQCAGAYCYYCAKG